MRTPEILIYVVPIMVLATQISRLTPLLLSGVHLPKNFEGWLTHIPVAILTAMIVPEFLTLDSPPSSISFNFTYLCAGLLCLVVGLYTRHLLLTTATGIFTVAVIRILG